MMLQETLLAIKNSLEKLNSNHILVTNEDINAIANYFKGMRKGSFIFPMKFITEVKIDMNKAYDILSNLEDSGFIEPIFQVYCHECNNFQKGYYLSLTDIETEDICEFCHNETGEKNIMVRYRVITE